MWFEQMRENAMTLAGISDHIEEAQDDLYQILRAIATAPACRGEILSTSRVLSNAEQRLSNVLNCGETCSSLYVFLPGNMVLYSLALYAIIPSKVTTTVLIRASGQSEPVLRAIFEVLGRYLPEHIMLWDGDREVFRKQALSNPCVFCGTYSMACQLTKSVDKNHPFMYLGSGINPFIVTASANLTRAVHCAVAERVFNGGRDCLCPDLFLVHQSVVNPFVESLVTAVKSLPIGRLDCDHTVICPMDNSAAVNRTRRFLHQFKDFIAYGGEFDTSLCILEPTIVVRPFCSGFSAPEFFGPLWNILVYKSNSEIASFLRDSHVIAKAQGITVFGCEEMAGLESYTLIGWNCGLQDVEDGNLPFGGWGGYTSFITYRGEQHNRPILVPAELALVGGNCTPDILL